VNDFPNISHALRTLFNAEHGLSEDVAIRIYCRAAKTSGKMAELRRELERAFADQTLSWKDMLLNDDYEVFDASGESEARAHALRILWTPIFDQ
jgi:hypothetical protein